VLHALTELFVFVCVCCKHVCMLQVCVCVCVRVFYLQTAGHGLHAPTELLRVLHQPLGRLLPLLQDQAQTRAQPHPGLCVYACLQVCLCVCVCVCVWCVCVCVFECVCV